MAVVAVPGAARFREGAMEGIRRLVQRTLHRKHVVSRLEQDIWPLVYEQFWPSTVAKAPRARPARIRAPFAPSSSSAFAKGA
jgi:hypothetical protein